MLFPIDPSLTLLKINFQQDFKKFFHLLMN